MVLCGKDESTTREVNRASLMGKKIRLSGPLVTARHSRAQEATVAHIIRSVYTLTLARNEKPAVITLKSTFAGRKTNYVEFACIRTTADRHG
ncbi:MAG: hypothetical protein WCE32_03650 [Pseudolabrys sp.]